MLANQYELKIHTEKCNNNDMDTRCTAIVVEASLHEIRKILLLAA